jgi:hypothetical protein
MGMASPRFDFTDDESVSFPSNNVYLTSLAAPISIKNHQALSSQVISSKTLAVGTERRT